MLDLAIFNRSRVPCIFLILVSHVLSLLVSGYEWREVPVDRCTRRKRVGIPCEVFQVASEH